MDEVVVRRALLSVYDKTGIAEFAAALAEMGVEIISSGGTAKAVEGAGVEVRYVQEWTGFPEMLGHRVVTLHPKVHGAILALRDDPVHQADIKKYDLKLIDLVCVSLYPFEQAVSVDGCSPAEAVEMIDIGGPTLIRAAAKNHRYVTVVTDRNQYNLIIDKMRGNGGKVGFKLRRRLAGAAFSLTCHYDTAISSYLAAQMGQGLPERISFSYRKAGDLRYGENPHQKAAFYVSVAADEESCVGRAKLMGGRELSYNNLFDTNGAVELVKEFDSPAVAIIKHANPAGCAVDEDLVEAYRKAYFGDVNACMGGIVAINRAVTPDLARAIVETYRRWGKSAGAGGFFAEVIAAPRFEVESLEIIRAREGWGKNVRLLELGELSGRRNNEKFLKYIVGGMLVQDRDLLGLNEEDWKVVTKRQPGEEELADMKFAWLVCKHVKSNAIVLAKDQSLLGAGAGQMSRVNSARLACQIARGYGGDGVVDTAGCSLASDAFFPFPDSLDWAADAGATAVIEPGGSKKDQDVIAKADQLGLTMIFTSARHFNH
ncbi:MAG: bifunctional phosphoribosylaminoimidazolecarboxamide formyltransferase/IMP cyclohydrolase [Phycisphaerae bacterium]|jgi:phosphoribosylaminoimidazolecarboxamide formyltransferase/IMP cyclohydrolase|nr:bifunctional phosphoribosylaminoimidazolecarboxamide formyltransferase/IMP cyclohydrolase [Phycisphaerae bacterium]MDP7636198.1 bifunctional phosphoribosylaminoimidazolecarboxamide formyltransferase/IMP cyclohydrolase [Phycisphaerae bacterium]